MTRLTNRDIDQITNNLVEYNKRLIASTGRDLLEIACYCHGVDVELVKQRAESFSVRAVPVTAGLGVITDFSDTVAAILSFLGISADVSFRSDVSGIASAIDDGVDGIFLADDIKFIGFNCNNRKMVDNGEATGRVYGGVMNLMATAGGHPDKDILVVGCGPVGRAAAEYLVKYGATATITLADLEKQKAEQLLGYLRQHLDRWGRGAITIRLASNIEEEIDAHDHILDATPDGCLIEDNLLTKDKRVAIPGVPPGISRDGFRLLGTRVIHDKLELGVAAMAVALLI
ncbi:MAG: 3-methylornithyl-N6-L-lysine dehydrogenase PylD [Desulforhopalus sp.]